MKSTILALIGALAFGLVPCAMAQSSVNVRGLVYDASTNSALSGVKVELKSTGLSATSDSKGFYRITRSTGLRSELASDIAARIRIEGTVLSFTIPEGAAVPVRIVATDLQGRSWSLHQGMVAPGSYSLPLSEGFQTQGVYLLEARLAGQSSSYKILVQSGRIALQATATSTDAVASRIAAVFDTLVLSKSGYTTAKVALASASDSVARTNLVPSTSTAPAIAGLGASVVGYATVGGSTTGGGSASPTTVKTCAELKAAAADKNSRVIMVSGTIKTTDCNGGSGLPIASNKTIQGADKSAKIYGGLSISGVSNVILRNFSMQGIYPNSGPDDAISVRNSHHVWVDHLNIWDGGDGNLDITNEATNVTVSWCKFWYTDKNHPHRLNALIGSGGGDHPEDWGKLKVTYHHNWFADLVDQRMPRLMYGQAHVYNNYYTSKGNGYCVGVGSYGSILVENNYFKEVKDPISFMYDVYAWIVQRGNTFDKTTGTGPNLNGKQGSRAVSGQDFAVAALSSVPYSYPLTPAADVPALVSKYAGPQ